MALIGGVLRFWRLDRPDRLVFDEIYYVKDAVAYLGAATSCRCGPF